MASDSRRGRGGGGKAAKAGAVINRKRDGRFIGTGKPTEKQRLICRELAMNGGNKAAAARTVGVAYDTVTQCVESAAGARELRRQRQVILESRLGPLALDTLEALMLDEDTPHGVRFQAARFALEASGHRGGNSNENNDLDDSTPLERMSVEQLERIVETGNAALEAYRRDQAIIDVTPRESAPNPPESDR